MKWIATLLLCLPAYGQTWFSNVTKSPTASSCTIHWTTAVPTIGHIKYGTASGSYTKYTSNSSTYSKYETRTITGLAAKTTYRFQMVSADTNKNWITSLDSTCTTTAPPTTAQHSVKLNWLASSSSGVSGYEVYRSTISGGYYALLANTAGLSYIDAAVNVGMTYYYVVKAITSTGKQSSYSSQVKASIP